MQFTVTEKRNYVSWGFKNTKNISLHLSIWNCVCVLWPLFVSWLESVKRKITVWKNTCCLTLQPHDNIKRAWCSTTITSAWVSWWGMTQTCCSVESICLRKSGTHHGVWYQLSYIWWFSQIATNDIYSHEWMNEWMNQDKICNVLEFCTGLPSYRDQIRSALSSFDSARTRGDKEQWFRSSGCQIGAIVENKFKTTPGVQEGW